MYRRIRDPVSQPNIPRSSTRSENAIRTGLNWHSWKIPSSNYLQLHVIMPSLLVPCRYKRLRCGTRQNFFSRQKSPMREESVRLEPPKMAITHYSDFINCFTWILLREPDGQRHKTGNSNHVIMETYMMHHAHWACKNTFASIRFPKMQSCKQ